MSEFELCGDCKKLNVYKDDDNLCNECSKYVNKYYCSKCQLKHGCNKGLWESKADTLAPGIEKLLKKFSQALIIEIDYIVSGLVDKNNELQKKIIDLEIKKE